MTVTQTEGKLGEITLAIESTKNKEKSKLSQYERDLSKWAKSIDRGYAWVVLVALWTLMAAVLGPYRLYGLLYAYMTNEAGYSRQEASWPVAAILTVENILGPLVSVIAYSISFRWCIFIGGALIVLGNGLAALSNSIIIDVILIGFIQGIGYAFIFMPFMNIVNNYFLRYRNMALGIALCGGTMSVLIWSPFIQWMLEEYPWRWSYYGLAAISSLSILTIVFLKPNPRPKLPIEPETQIINKTHTNPDEYKGSLSRISVKALSYQNSMRRQSVLLISRRSSNLKRQDSVVSTSAWASSAKLESRLSPANICHETNDQTQVHHQDQLISLSEVGKDSDENNFKVSFIWDILKSPAFHLIWYNELVYFWVFSIYCLVAIDFGEDRGCSKDEAKTLLSYQSIGELVGRLVLPMLVDLKFMSLRATVCVVLLVLASSLFTVTQVTGFVWMASITSTVAAFASLLYILLNSLMVEYLGEQRVTIAFGMASCVSGVLMSVRPQVVGYFRDSMGSYDGLMICLGTSCLIGLILWILEPLFTRMFCAKQENSESCEQINTKA